MQARWKQAVSLVLVVAAVAATTAAAAPGARAIRRPAGSPDLASIALGKPDFPLGGEVTSGTYVREPGALAAYERELLLAVGNQAALLYADNEVGYFPTAKTAAQWADSIAAGYRSAAFRNAFVKSFKKALAEEGKSGKGAKVTLGRLRPLGIGPHSFELPASVTSGGVRFTAAFAVFSVDRVGSAFFAIGLPGRPLSFGGVAALNKRIAGRIPAALTPLSRTAPSISGVPQSGQTLTAHAGTWAYEPTTFAFQWLRCDAAGGACAPIGGATTESYAVADSDVGSTVRVQVTASNGVSASTPLQSSQTPVVVSAGSPAPAALPNPSRVVELAVCPERDLVDDEGVSVCRKNWSAEPLPTGEPISCTFQVLEAVGARAVVELRSAETPVFSWSGTVIWDPHWYVWVWAVLPVGPGTCHVAVGGVTAELPFTVTAA